MSTLTDLQNAIATHNACLDDLELELAQLQATVVWVNASEIINKNNGAHTLKLKLYTKNAQPLPEPLTVQIQDGGGSAQPNVHYTFSPSSVTFPANSSDGDTEDITITPIPNAITSDKSVILKLTPSKLGTISETKIDINADPVCVSPITFDISECYALNAFSSGFGESVLDNTFGNGAPSVKSASGSSGGYSGFGVKVTAFVPAGTSISSVSFQYFYNAISNPFDVLAINLLIFDGSQNLLYTWSEPNSYGGSQNTWHSVTRTFTTLNSPRSIVVSSGVTGVGGGAVWLDNIAWS